MSDSFKNFTPGLESPAIGAQEVTPDDASDLPTVSRALNAGNAGSVRVTMLDDSIATLAIGAGVLFPVRVKRVWSSGTTATSIVALY